MKITDEQLSAFLDAELSEPDMEAIREQLIDDENLANRLAELAMVDEVVATTYTRIDTKPLPQSVSALLADADGTDQAEQVNEKMKTAKIITLPGMQHFQYILQKHMAIAAGIVMVLGLGAIKVLHEASSDNSWQQVADLLEVAPSGVEITHHNMEIKPRLTFVSKQGDYCRQYKLTNKKVITENIACRKNGSWQQVVSVTVDKAQETNSYQTASGGSLLDATLDEMARDDFFDATSEAKVIDQHWPAP